MQVMVSLPVEEAKSRGMPGELKFTSPSTGISLHSYIRLHLANQVTSYLSSHSFPPTLTTPTTPKTLRFKTHRNRSQVNAIASAFATMAGAASTGRIVVAVDFGTTFSG